MSAFHRALIGLCLGVVALGCAPDLEDPERFEDLDCNYDVPTQLLAPRCGTAECHDGHEPAQGMDLLSGNLAERLVGIESTTCLGHMRIDPANPSASYILEMVSAEPDCDGTAVSGMPLTGTPLSDDEIACLTAWVEEVAALYPDRMGGGGPRDAGGPMDAGAGEVDAGAGDGG